MPCGQSVIAQLGIDAVVAVAVDKTACDPCDPGIGVNVAQGIQCPLAVVGRKGAAVIALFPKMPGPLEHPVKAHGAIPVEPVHDAGQIFMSRWFNQIMDVVAHHAESVKMKLILLLGPPDGVNKDFATKFAAQVEAAIVAPDRDMVGVVGLKLS